MTRPNLSNPVLCTPSEFYGWHMYVQATATPLTSEPVDFHAAGNRIIALAEQIKAERAVAAMQ